MVDVNLSTPDVSARATKPAQLPATVSSTRSGLARAHAPLQEQRARAGAFFSLFEDWSRRAANLSIAALYAGTAAALTVSSLNFLSELVPAVGAHAFPWTMGAGAAFVGAYFGYGRENIKRIRNIEAIQRVVQTQNTTQGAIIESTSQDLKQLSGLGQSAGLDQAQLSELMRQVIANTDLKMRHVALALSGGAPEVIEPPHRASA